MKRALIVAAAAAFMIVGAATGAEASSSADTGSAVAGVQIGPASSWAVTVNDSGVVAGDLSVNNQTEGFVWHGGKLNDLGFLPGGGDTEVSGIDQRGDVVGEAETGDGTWHAFVWREDTLIDLGTAGGNSAAVAINDRGRIIGTSDTADGQVNAVVWRDGTMTTLPGLGGYTNPVAQDDAGLIAGTSQDASGEPHAVVWSHGKLVDLGPGNAVAVNSGGQVLVWAYTAGQAPTAFLWHNGTKTPLPSGLWSVVGLNDEGQVIGTYGTDGAQSFVWQHGTMTDLGTAQPLKINDLGQVLAYVPSDSGPRGEVLSHGQAITLSPTSGSFADAAAINDNGLVAGQSGTPESATVWQVAPTT